MQQVGKPVTGRNLIGRKKEIELLKAYLKMGQSVVVIAPRRMGKTSLIIETLRQIKREKNYTVFVDIFSTPTMSMFSQTIVANVLENKKLKSIFNKTKHSALEMLRQVKMKAVIEDFEFIIGFAESDQDEWEIFSKSLDFIDEFGKKNGRQTVVAFDEFGDIGKFDHKDKMIKLMRSKIQRQENAVYIFSGSYESVMQEMFVDSKSPFYRLARIIKLGYIDQRLLVNDFIKKMKKISISISKKVVEEYIDISKGHPYYAQLALQQTALFHTMNRRLPTNEELLIEMLAVEKDYLEKLWEDLSSNKEYVFILRELAIEPIGIYGKAKKTGINASRAINQLEGKGMIYRKDKGYQFYDPLFELWIAKYIN